jgi:hypothetical protein
MKPEICLRKPFIFIWILFLWAGLFAYTDTVKTILAPDTLVITKGKKILLAGVVFPGDIDKQKELLVWLKKHLLKKMIIVKEDSILNKKEKPKLQKGKKKVKEIRLASAYVSFACDTCGSAMDAPEFRGTTVIITKTYQQIELNTFLIQEGHCSADTSSYEKKSYFLYLQSQVNKK